MFSPWLCSKSLHQHGMFFCFSRLQNLRIPKHICAVFVFQMRYISPRCTSAFFRSFSAINGFDMSTLNAKIWRCYILCLSFLLPQKIHTAGSWSSVFRVAKMANKPQYVSADLSSQIRVYIFAHLALLLLITTLNISILYFKTRHRTRHVCLFFCLNIHLQQSYILLFLSLLAKSYTTPLMSVSASSSLNEDIYASLTPAFVLSLKLTDTSSMFCCSSLSRQKKYQKT